MDPVPSAVPRQSNPPPTLLDVKLSSGCPELVQPEDPSAPDPFALQYLRAMPDWVDIPEHWRCRRARLLLPEKKQIDFRIPEQYNGLVMQYKRCCEES